MILGPQMISKSMHKINIPGPEMIQAKGSKWSR